MGRAQAGITRFSAGGGLEGGLCFPDFRRPGQRTDAVCTLWKEGQDLLLERRYLHGEKGEKEFPFLLPPLVSGPFLSMGSAPPSGAVSGA